MAKPPSGPIPGENYTSDTRNYPWHRPPQYTNMNEAFEYIAEHLMDEDVSTGILTMLEMEVSVAELTDMIITAGIGGGKFTVDFGLLLAGPIAHMICLMARRYDLDDINLGVDTGLKAPTKAFFDAFEKASQEGEDASGEVGEAIGTAMGLGGDTESPEAEAPEGEPSVPSTGLGGLPSAPQPAPSASLGAPTGPTPTGPVPEEEEEL